MADTTTIMDHLTRIQVGYSQALKDGIKINDFFKSIRNGELFTIFSNDYSRRQERQAEINKEINRKKSDLIAQKRKIFDGNGGLPKEIEISAAMIVKNEEETIEQTIISIYNFVDEIVVLDTGSTDRTIEILKKYPKVIIKEKKVVPWSFSFARNIAKAPCRGKTIISIDADEIFVPHGEEAREMITDDAAHTVIINMANKNWKDYLIDCRFAPIRIFPNHKNISWFGRAHNQLAYGDRDYLAVSTPIEIYHLTNESKKKQQARDKRTLKLMNETIKEIDDGDESFRNYYVVLRMAIHLGDKKLASEYADKGLRGFKLLPPPVKEQNGDFLLMGARAKFMAGDHRNVVQFAARHQGLMGETADNCFYAYCLYNTDAELEQDPVEKIDLYYSAFEHARKYLYMIDAEIQKPFMLQETLRYYDDMLLRIDLLDYWRHTV